MPASEKFGFNQPRVQSEKLNFLTAPLHVYTVQLEKECQRLDVPIFSNSKIYYVKNEM